VSRAWASSTRTGKRSTPRIVVRCLAPTVYRTPHTAPVPPPPRPIRAGLAQPSLGSSLSKTPTAKCTKRSFRRWQSWQRAWRRPDPGTFHLQGGPCPTHLLRRGDGNRGLDESGKKIKDFLGNSSKVDEVMARFAVTYSRMTTVNVIKSD
jgi:hypothetical protein